MDRAKMISDLEEYWYKLQADNPQEEVGDIPGAVMYYRTLPLDQLLAEWEEKCC